MIDGYFNTALGLPGRDLYSNTKYKWVQYFNIYEYHLEESGWNKISDILIQKYLKGSIF